MEAKDWSFSWLNDTRVNSISPFYQGEAQCCWAVSLEDVMSLCYLIKSHGAVAGKILKEKDVHDVVCSPQDPLDWLKLIVKPKYDERMIDKYGCYAANPEDFLEYGRVHGCALAQDYPFTGERYDEFKGYENFKYAKRWGHEAFHRKYYRNEDVPTTLTNHIFISSYDSCPADDVYEVVNQISSEGPMIAGVVATNSFMNHTGDRIFVDFETLSKPVAPPADHSVTVLGGGREGGADYYLARNPQGPRWGINGVGKIAAINIPQIYYVKGLRKHVWIGMNEARVDRHL